jgi:hypothetical protein
MYFVDPATSSIGRSPVAVQVNEVVALEKVFEARRPSPL